MSNYYEQVYDCYYDTAGNYHWTGVYSGEHIERGGRVTKEEAIKKTKAYLTDYLPQEEYGEVEEIIEALQQPQHVHGEWIKYGDKYKCSKCFATMQMNPINPNLKDRFFFFFFADMRKGETNE